MKKILLIIIATFSFAITDAADTSNTVTNCINSEITAQQPTYWSGWASSEAGFYYRIYIKVYRTENTCDSFYAVATKKEEINNLNGARRTYEINETLVVREKGNGKYYVVYDNVKYFFSM